MITDKMRNAKNKISEAGPVWELISPRLVRPNTDQTRFAAVFDKLTKENKARFTYLSIC